MKNSTVVAAFVQNHHPVSPPQRNTPFPGRSSPMSVASKLRSSPSTLLNQFHAENKSRRDYLYNYLNFSKALKHVVDRVEQLKDKKKKRMHSTASRS